MSQSTEICIARHTEHARTEVFNNINYDTKWEKEF